MRRDCIKAGDIVKRSPGGVIPLGDNDIVCFGVALNNAEPGEMVIVMPFRRTPKRKVEIEV